MDEYGNEEVARPACPVERDPVAYWRGAIAKMGDDFAPQVPMRDLRVIFAALAAAEQERNGWKPVEEEPPPVPGEIPSAFGTLFSAVAAVVHRDAVERGFWDGERNRGEVIALMHSELSECLEFIRHGNPPDDHIPEFSGAEAEMADVIIRIMDAADAFGWDVAGALLAKVAHNRGRPFKHGKAF